jgi:hypothetical protein
MTIQTWALFSEIVGAVAVVVTLAYVALQIKQSNTATHRQMYMAAAAGLAEYWVTLAQDYPLYELFVSMLRAPAELSRTDKERAYLVMDSYLTLMESYYLHNRQYGEDISQARWERILRRMFATPGGNEYWLKRRFAYHDEFAGYVDRLLSVPDISAPPADDHA